MSKEENKTDLPVTETPAKGNETNAEAAPTPNEANNDAQPKENTDLPPNGKPNQKEHDISSKSGSLGKLLAEELDKNIPDDNQDEKKDVTKPPEEAKDDNMVKKPKTSDELLDNIIDDEMNKMKGAKNGDKSKEKEGQTDEEAKQSDEQAKQSDEEAKDAKKESVADDIYPGAYSIQDDVRFLKFVSNLNEQPCTCNAAGNDFVLEDFGTNCHKQGCPSTLSPKDIESIKVIFLVRHLPVCKRFLTQNERQVLKNILKTAPYYQMEFYNRHSPYEIQSDSQDLIQDHMVEERKFPKSEDQKDISKVKKTILATLRANVKSAPPVTDGNRERFPVEEFKFGEKYQNKPKEQAIDINDYPYDKPKTSTTANQNQRNKNNAEIMDERLILNLLNDMDAWNCFTSICICDVIQTEEGCSQESESNQLKAALLEGVPKEQKKALSDKIDKVLEYFDDLIKARLKEKIDREREYMQILCDGKLKKEELFVEILSYKNKNVKKNKQEVSMMVNDMFRELIRNNKDIGRDMENKLNKENEFMERDIFNKMKLKMASDLKLGHPKNKILERYIQDVLHDKFDQEYELIKSELEFELEKCDEKSLRLLQDLLDQMNKDRGHHDYNNINEYFKALYPPTEKPTSPYGGSSASAADVTPPRVPSPERPRGRKVPPEQKKSSRDREPERHDDRQQEPDRRGSRDSRVQEPDKRESRDPRHQELDRRESRDPRQQERDRRESRDSRLQEPDRRDSRDPRLQEPDRRDSRDPRLQEPDRRDSRDSRLQVPDRRDSRDPRLQEPDRRDSRDPRLQEPDRRESRQPRLQEPDRRDSRMREPAEKSRSQKYETPAGTSATPSLDQRDPHTQPAPSKQRPKTLTEEIDKLMDDLWNDARDQADLIRQLVHELKRYDLNDRNPQEKALSTKKSYNDFKDDMESKLRPIPDRRTDRSGPNRPVRQVPSEPTRPNDDNIITLFDQAFQYIILELPMHEQKIELYHDSFYGKRRTLAEVNVLPEARQIRTDIDMKN
ncbi:hypothetical protein WDU94_001168 [Cyamophila willieti]